MYWGGKCVIPVQTVPRSALFFYYETCSAHLNRRKPKHPYSTSNRLLLGFSKAYLIHYHFLHHLPNLQSNGERSYRTFESE